MKKTNNLLKHIVSGAIKMASFCVLLAGLGMQVYGQKWTNGVRKVASDRSIYDQYGTSVSIDGDYAIIGAHRASNDASGASYLSAAGSVYIQHNDPVLGWKQTQKLVASDRRASDEFGISVAISGEYAVVGARYNAYEANGAGTQVTAAGAVYIFKRNGSGVWSQVQKIVASDRESSMFFGTSVAIDGDYIVVGAPYESKDTIGNGVVYDAGAAYVFKNNAGVWSEYQKLYAADRRQNDKFGNAVAISGNALVVGASSSSLDANGQNQQIGGGAVYVYLLTGSTWVREQKLVSPNRQASGGFGASISVSGNYLAIGALGESVSSTVLSTGVAYVFQKVSGSWGLMHRVNASDFTTAASFGKAISISGNLLAVSALKTSVSNINGAGCAYMYKLNSGTGVWHHDDARRMPSTNNEATNFGWSLGLSGKNLMVGAIYDQVDGSGGNPIERAGGVFIYNRCATESEFTVSACGTYVWPVNGNTYGTTGVYTHTMPNAAGCDSVATLKLTVYPLQNTATENKFVCGGSYAWRGTTYTTSGTYYESELYQNTTCDSVRYVLNLTLYGAPTHRPADVVEACGNSYAWHGKTYTATGVYVDTVMNNSTGCPLYVDTLDLTLKTTIYEAMYTYPSCDASFVWYGNTYTQSGIYRDTVKYVGTTCDSVVYTVNLKLMPYLGTGDTTIVEACGSSYLWNGYVQVQYPGSFFTETPQYAGYTCDSIEIAVDVTLHGIDVEYTPLVVDTICEGDTYQWYGSFYTQAGYYTEVVMSVNHSQCDSVVHELQLVVLPHDVTVSFDGDEIMANQTGADYQWINCANNTPIAGETSQVYIPVQSGDYAAVVTNAATGCSDTSACVAVSKIGIAENATTLDWKAYPNPTTGVLNVTGLPKDALLSLIDATGRVLYNAKTTGSNMNIDFSHLAAGVYNLSVELGKVKQNKRVVIYK